MYSTMNSKDNSQICRDTEQFSQRGLQRYEWIFGKTFLSTGGMATTKKYVDMLNLKAGQKVLDVGCGLGGHSFYMAENYDVEVLGVELMVNIMTAATEHLSRRPHLQNKVKFIMCDITTEDYEDNTYDAIYCRDSLMYIKNKDELLRKFEKWLKPGGKLVTTDYTRGEKDLSPEYMKYIADRKYHILTEQQYKEKWLKPEGKLVTTNYTRSEQELSPEYIKYIADRKYHLLTEQQYKELLQNSGFVNIKVHNVTEELLTTLHAEIKKLRDEKEQFLQKFSEEDYKYLEEIWTSKIQRAAEGNQTWTACYAEKSI